MRPSETIIHQAKHELLTMSRFTLVGIAAACVHIGIVWGLITQLGTETLFANLVAFLSAFIVSFTGQYLWTFRSKRNWQSALIRFFLISLLGFGVNNLVLITMLDVGLTSDSLAAVLSACIIPVVTYLAGRFWAFKC
jgi:putative flippase GtrA